MDFSRHDGEEGERETGGDGRGVNGMNCMEMIRRAVENRRRDEENQREEKDKNSLG